MIKKAVSLIFLLSLYSSNLGAYNKPGYVTELFIARNLDITMKSYLGWARVINDAVKREEYNLADLNHSEVELYTQQLKELSKSNSSTFEGKLK